MMRANQWNPLLVMMKAESISNNNAVTIVVDN